ncbi:MAG: ATP-binding protein, partial [Lysobacteraceae bacterium]
LRLALLRLSRRDKAKDLASRGLRALAGFAKSLKLKYADLEVGIDLDPEPGLADNGDLEHDLQALLEAAARAAQADGTALVLFIDELQYVPEEQLASLVTALHRCAQQQVPVVLVGAGLPSLPGQMGRAKSYAERLFAFPFIGPLDATAARDAIEVPAAALGVRFEPAATEAILHATEGYPYFLQEWGKHAWDVAKGSPITVADVERAAREAVAALDESFFRVRFDRLTLAEKRYLRAMAALGPGPHRSGDIADTLGRKVTAMGPIRAQLIDKGMVWSPNHGDTAFTVPMFDAYLRRILPGEDWREG